MSAQERRERDRAQRYRLIVTAARELAESEGWDAVTTRRLSERIEYSQPVLYSHFSGKEAIMGAVALEGFEELAAELAATRPAAPVEALRALCETYLEFALSRPALYDAMFVLPTGLEFAVPETPEVLKAAFNEIQRTVAPFAGETDSATLAELTWSALHGFATLTRTGRMRTEQRQNRVDLLVHQICGA
jgi:AcrR family transcriptional regulator